MSKTKEVYVLKHGDVQKKIIAKAPIPRSKDDQLGPLNKYRDELFEGYNRKKKLFFDTCKKYNRLNQETLICSKKRLLEDYKENLECDDLVYSDGEECKANCPCDQVSDGLGTLLRRRTERPIHEVTEPSNDPCLIEPWFKRYLILNKFIWAARTIIIKNRLMKVLDKLKAVDAETIKASEKHRGRFLNISYSEIFEKFMNN